MPMTMQSDAPGCFLFGVLGALTGGSKPALAAMPPLPKLVAARMDRADLPALVRARNSAESCYAVLRSKRAVVGEEVLRDVGLKVSEILASLYGLGERLSDARRFLVEHAPEKLAAKRTQLELDEMEAGADQLREIRATQAALDKRSEAARTVAADVRKMAGRLGTGVEELGALSAELAARLGDAGLIGELESRQRAASDAADALEATLREIGT